MTKRLIRFSLVMLGVSGCGQQPQDAGGNNAQLPVPATANDVSPEPAAPPAASGNATLPDDRTPLEEPSGPIDPKSVEAAGQVVQLYGALIEQDRWTESWKLWSNADSARQFDRNWRTASEVHIEIGKPGDAEGAAGSIYCTVPVIFYGKQKAGGDFRRAASVILRRVNDVPGSTEAQRRWHIERIQFSA